MKEIMMKDQPVILIVDDQPQNLELLEAHLVPQGYEIVKAASGEEALEKLHGRQIDLILLDVMMTGIDGFEVTRRIRKDKVQGLIPIILVTSLHETEDRIKGIEAGCDDFLSKPFDKMELLARVRSLLKVKDYNDLKNNYRKLLEAEVSKGADELRRAWENQQQDGAGRAREEAAVSNLAAIVDSSNDAIIGKTLDGVITSWNKGAQALYGYSPIEAIGQPVAMLLPPGLSDEVPQILEKIRNGQTVGHYETVRLTKGGKLVDISLTVSPITDKSGAITGASTIARDNSEHKRAEEALRESKEQLEQRVIERTHELQAVNEELNASNEEITASNEELRMAQTELQTAELYARGLIEANLDALVTIGPDGKITDVNKSTEQATGVSRARLVGSDFATYFTEPVKAQAGYRQVFAQGFVRDYPLALKNASGGVIDVLYNAVTYKDQSGQVQGVFAAARDITERKKMEDTMRKLQEEQRIILDSVPAWIFYKDKENRFIRVNQAFADVMGMPKVKLEGKAMIDFYPKEQADAFGADDLKVITSGQPKRNIIESMDSPKGTLWVQTDKIPYRDAQGSIIGIIGFTIDITELKKAEDVIQYRTVQLESSNKELESFAYSVSHDLRVPLRAIDGFSKIVIEDYGDKLDDEGRRLLKVVRDNTKKMSKLIDDLLTYSRIGRQEAAKGTVNMAALARSVVDEMEQANPGRRVSVTIGKLPPAMGDSTMLRQVLMNLVANSFKFTRLKPDAEVEIGFTTEEGTTWYFVKDNGAGFDMRFADKLFGVFQRLHSQEEFEGTGVGLAIAQRVIHKHGGKIRGEGEVGKGAAFYFTLPG